MASRFCAASIQPIGSRSGGLPRTERERPQMVHDIALPEQGNEVPFDAGEKALAYDQTFEGGSDGELHQGKLPGEAASRRARQGERGLRCPRNLPRGLGRRQGHSNRSSTSGMHDLEDGFEELGKGIAGAVPFLLLALKDAHQVSISARGFGRFRRSCTL
jgi:hypothetical protein